MKPIQAMTYLSLSRDSFDVWCDAVQLRSYKYEFSNRNYYLSGEFYALADKNEIQKIKQLHGDRWNEFYGKYDDVLPFISDDKPKQRQVKYKPESEAVADFIKRLKE
jgi:hypothetical protein